MRGYHFVGDKLRDGRPVPPDGEWLVHDGPCVMCKSGLHVSEHPFDALHYAPGSTLCLVEYEDEQERHHDKILCLRRKIIARFDATALLRQFGREDCTAMVLHLWPDPPAVVVHWLLSGEKEYRVAARAAARAATWAATWAAADAAALAAARAAADAAAAAATWAAADAAALAAARAAAAAAAWAAADAAARAAADAAAEVAAWDAARAATWAATRQRFKELVDAEFSAMGVL